MSGKATEAIHEKAEGLDLLASAEALALLARGQQNAASTVSGAIPAIAEGAELVAAALRAGRKLVYAGAGSSGLMALADALELPGTYGIAREQILLLLAGGISSLGDLPGGPEDDVALAASDAAPIGAGDCVLCVTASGSTPYVLAIASIARERGARVVAIANNSDARIFGLADVSVLLATPPEVIGGSTRMGAGTAQKIAFNMMSTLAAIRLGHVHDGHMVNLRADNDKLRARAAGMVARIAGTGEAEAAAYLVQAGGSVKIAVLLASGAEDAEAAGHLLDRSGQSLRGALSALAVANNSIRRAAKR